MPLTPRLRLFATLALIIVPLSLLQIVWRLILNADSVTVTDGVLRLGNGGWPEALVTLAVWVYALAVGIFVLSGGPGSPLRQAWRAFPTALAASLGAIGAVVTSLLLLGLLLPAPMAPIVIAGLILLLPLGLLLVRLTLVLPVAVFEGLRGADAFRAAWVRARGNTWATGLILAMGVVAPALFVGWISDVLDTAVSSFGGGLAFWFARDVAFVALAAMQAFTIVGSYRLLQKEQLEVVQPTDTSFGRLVTVFTVALLMVPAAVVAGIVTSQSNPEVTTRDFDRGRLISVAWPADRHPVVVGQSAIYDCLDDRCDSFDVTNLSVTMYEPTGGVAFGSDGSVYALGQDHLEHCDRQRICSRHDGRLEALAKSQAEAIALSPYGEILIGTASEVPHPSRPKETAIELGLVRCRDVFCKEPAISTLGVVDGSLERTKGPRWREPAVIAVGTGRFGRPIVGFRSPSSDGPIQFGSCDTVQCATTSLAAPGADELLPFNLDGVTEAVEHEAFTKDAVRIQLGEPQQAARWAVLMDGQHRIPLIEVPETYSNMPGPPPNEYWLMAANPDGRMILVQVHPTKIVLVKP